jgi:hypothetical protein
LLHQHKPLLLETQVHHLAVLLAHFQVVVLRAQEDLPLLYQEMDQQAVAVLVQHLLLAQTLVALAVQVY